MERQRFEDSWKESFKEAEISPSDSLWTNVELDLEKENSSKMKRRMMFFQLLAAASVAFAMTFAGVGVYFMMNDNNNDNQAQLATKIDPSKSAKPQTQAQSSDNTLAADQAAGMAHAATRSMSDEVITADKDNTSAYGPGRPASPVETPVKDSHTSPVLDRIAPSSSSNHVAATTNQTTPATNRIASASDPVIAGSNGARPSSNRSSASTSDKTVLESNRIAAASNQTSPGSNRVASASGHSSSESSRVATAPGETVSELNGKTPISDPAISTSNRIAAASDRTTPASNGVSAEPDQITSKRKRAVTSDSSIPSSNRIASVSDQITSSSNRVTTAPGQATSESNHAASTSDPVVPTSNRVATTSGQATSAPEQANTDPARQPEVAANPFTSVVAATSPVERPLSTMQGPLPPIAHPAEPSLAVANGQKTFDEPDPVALMLARLDDQEKQYAQEEKEKKKKDKGTERLWTSVGVAAGAYSMVTSGSAPASNLSNQLAMTANSSSVLTQDIVRKQSSASGTAYSVGLNLGAKLATRWVLQGGVNYLTQSSGYNTNAAVSTDNSQYALASINELDKISNSGRQDTKVIPTAAYRVNSSLSYLSVPLQAGYLVVNRAFGLQFNAGVSTDLFVKNTLTPDGGTLQKSTQTRSDDTPYRPLNFSGLVGTELSYRFGPHYRLALNPGLRYPFSSIYKSDIAVNAMPLTFDVGLKFRYIFH